MSEHSTGGVAFEPNYPPFRWLRGSRMKFAGLLAFWIVIWIAYTVLFKYWISVSWTKAVLMTVVLHAFTVTCDGVRLVRWRRAVQ